MKRDPNGYIDCDSTAPTTRVGKIAAVLWAVVCLVIFLIGLGATVALLLRAVGRLP